MKEIIFNEGQLNRFTKKQIIELFLSQQEQLQKQTTQLEELNRKFDLICEQLTMSRTDRFAQKTEKFDYDQLTLCFNEAEVTIETDCAEEPLIEEVIPAYKRKKRPKGKRDEDLSGLPVREEYHELSEKQLSELFPNGYRRLPDRIYKKLDFHPATFEVIEHHVAYYSAKNEDKIISAERPSEILKNSIVTPSLLAAVLNFKYVNAMPLYRLEQEFKRNDIHISRQTMSSWVIKSSERYLSLLYDRMHQQIYQGPVIHADETPVKVKRDGRDTMCNSYMWVYRTGTKDGQQPVILYEYQKTRNSSHPAEFLKGYEGTIVCDGFEAYHKIARENAHITVAGCWTHARRKYVQICKALGKKASKGSLAEAAVAQIGAIYHTDNSLDGYEPEQRKKRRKEQVSPLVDAFFSWVRSNIGSVGTGSALYNAMQYSLNQERYLRAFLDDPLVPLDNNNAEIAIRSFCVGRNNWHVIDTVNGAKASAMIYSITETAKANQLKPYEYLKYLLIEIPKHMEDRNLDFLEELLPWSEHLPTECKK